MPGKGKTTHHCPLRNGKKGNCRGGAKVPHSPSTKYCSAHQAYCSVPGCEIIFLQGESCWEHGMSSKGGMSTKGKASQPCPLRNGKKGNCRSGAKVPYSPATRYCSVHQAYCLVPGCGIIFLQGESCREHGLKKQK